MGHSRASLARYAWLSIAAALATILLKSVAFWITGSMGLLSDAVESLVNLVGASHCVCDAHHRRTTRG